MEKKFEEKFGLKTEEMEEILGGVTSTADVGSFCGVICSSCIGCSSSCLGCTSCTGCTSSCTSCTGCIACKSVAFVPVATTTIGEGMTQMTAVNSSNLATGSLGTPNPNLSL